LQLTGQHLGKLPAHQLLDFFTGAHHKRKAVAAVERLAGVDHDPCVARIVGSIGHWIERRRPTAAQRLHVLARIKPRAHRPYDFIGVGWIDVVVDHHDETVGIGAGMTLRSDQSGLLGVAGILLLDRDGEPQPAAAGGMRPDAFDFRHTRRFELIPHRAGPIGAAIK